MEQARTLCQNNIKEYEAKVDGHVQAIRKELEKLQQERAMQVERIRSEYMRFEKHYAEAMEKIIEGERDLKARTEILVDAFGKYSNLV